MFYSSVKLIGEHWLSAAGYWLLAIGYWLLAVSVRVQSSKFIGA